MNMNYTLMVSVKISNTTNQHFKVMESIEDKYTIRSEKEKMVQKNKKHDKYLVKQNASKQFLAAWLQEKRVIVQKEKDEKEELNRQAIEAKKIVFRKERDEKDERNRQALEITILRRQRQIQEAKQAWGDMPSLHRSWLLGLYEDMHYDHINGYSYAKRDNDNYGVWEYYLDHANELWATYKYD